SRRSGSFHHEMARVVGRQVLAESESLQSLDDGVEIGGPDGEMRVVVIHAAAPECPRRVIHEMHLPVAAAEPCAAHRKVEPRQPLEAEHVAIEGSGPFDVAGQYRDVMKDEFRHSRTPFRSGDKGYTILACMHNPRLSSSFVRATSPTMI